MIAGRALGPFFTPHDDVPRWPPHPWLAGLRSKLEKANPEDLERIAVCMNNLALLAVHARDAELACRLCRQQIAFFERTATMVASLDGASRFVCQPILNLMRLAWRQGGNDLRGPAGWLGPEDSGRLRRDSSWTPLWAHLRDTKFDPEITIVADNVFARELAGAVARGKLEPDDARFAFRQDRIGRGMPAPILARSVLAEALLMVGKGQVGDEVADLHPFLVGLYALLLDVAVSSQDLRVYLELLLHVRPCTRAMAEIAIETIVQIRRHDIVDTSEPARILLRYIKDLGDEALLIRYHELILKEPLKHLVSIYSNNIDANASRWRLASGVSKLGDWFEDRFLSN